MNKMTHMNQIRRLSCLLLTALMLVMSTAAMASPGDRTLLGSSSDGSFRYVSSLMITGKTIWMNVYGTSDMLVAYDTETGETNEYSVQEMLKPEAETENSGEDGAEENAEEQADESVLAWFSWQGELYGILTRTIGRAEELEIEGGFIRKVTVTDGKAELTETELPRLEWDDMIERSGGSVYSRSIRSLVVSGDWLAVVAYEDDGNQLHLFDLRTGEAEIREISAADAIGKGPEGKLLLGRYNYGEDTELIVESYDIEEDETELFIRFKMDGYDSIRSLAYREETDTLYYTSNGEVFALQGRNPEDAQSVNECSISGELFADLTEDGFLAVHGYDGAVLRNTDPSQRSEVTIRIRPFIWSDGANTAYYAFTDKRGDISVIREDFGDETALLQAMMNQDDRVDIYTISQSSSAYSAIYDRGFMGDLSGSEKLTAAVDGMYEFVREACRKDGKLVAIPVRMSGDHMGYDTEAWEKLGFTKEELPRTWDQFLDLLEVLPDRLEGTEYRAFEFYTSQEELRNTILNRIIRNYAILRPDDSFNTPMLQRLMDRVMKLDLEPLGLFTNEEIENDDVYSRWDELGGNKTALLTTYRDAGLTSYSSNTQALPLMYEEGEEPALPVELGVAFMNPYSKHPQEAMAYLECMMENLEITTVYSFEPARTEPLRYADHEEQRKNLNQWLESARKNLEEQEDEEARETWEGYIKEMEEELENFDRDHWQISPETIANYQERAAWFRTYTFDLWSMLYDGENGEAFSNLWEGYTSGQKSAQEVLSFMDQKVRMMRMEGN